MKNKSCVRERMIRFPFGVGRGYNRREFVARFWMAVDEHYSPTLDGLHHAIQRVVDDIPEYWTVEQITNHFGIMVQRCNAVEVLDSRGDGCLMYPSCRV